MPTRKETAMIKRLARAIARENGDDYDSIPASKQEWNSRRGIFGGRPRDINEPMQPDYDDMARAAMKEVRDMIDAALD